ncbi:unnamed protein product [Ceutorhynchus assimilis]|uniref:Myb/SANT-like DNA-binding domain-containing protein n=1 Tax=Ceutorhynchus assimilis TaxID=467358 RepID=A0A9N9MGA4_9CUCU|nr:unnamed protein product [Ceutorhynchus assimilis]
MDSTVPSTLNLDSNQEDTESNEHSGGGEILMWSSRKPLSTDVQATTYLLELRKEMSNQFDDRKHSKNTLWQQIAKKLNEKNFFVGQGLEGAEKCRKKFANLQASYVKYKDKKKGTGEGYICKPPFYDELDEILGFKDKITPQLLIDSSDKLIITEKKSDDKENKAIPHKKTPLHELPSTSNPEANYEKNKFASIRSSSKPKDKHTLFEEMIQA